MLRATIRHSEADFTKDFTKELTPRQKQIIEAIATNERITTNQIAGLTSVSRQTIQKDINELVSKGLIRHEGGRKDGYWIIVQ